jgi:hypothetical protein
MPNEWTGSSKLEMISGAEKKPTTLTVSLPSLMSHAVLTVTVDVREREVLAGVSPPLTHQLRGLPHEPERVSGRAPPTSFAPDADLSSRRSDQR